MKEGISGFLKAVKIRFDIAYLGPRRFSSKETFYFNQKMRKWLTLKVLYYRRSFRLRFKPVGLYHIRKVHKAIPKKKMDRHVYLCGKTGSGKSSLIEQRMYGLWYFTRNNPEIGVILIDPHGETSERVKKFNLSKSYFDRLVYVDPFLKAGYTPCINPMEFSSTDIGLAEFHAQHLVEVFGELLPDAKLSNYMKAILKPCLTLLLMAQACSLRDVQDMMHKQRSQGWIEKGMKSPILSHRKFFREEFHHRLYDYTKNSIYTKIQSLLNSTAFYHFTEGKSTIDLERCMRQGKFVVFNLSKGRLGEDISATLGRFIIAKIKSLALQRAKLPPHLRKPIYLVVDEADTFLKGNSLNVILQEARKYGLHLVLCTQNLISGKEQERLKRNVLSNTNMKIIGANGLSTLSPLSKETNIPLQELQRLKSFSFRIHISEKAPKKIFTRNVFYSGSALLLNRHQTRSINHRIIHKTAYYKPIKPNHFDPDDWVEELPWDMREGAILTARPLPKFTLN